MMIGLAMSYPYLGEPGGNGNYDYVQADNTNYAYLPDPYIEIYLHSGQTCEYDLYPSYHELYGKEDELKVKVWEDDMWPNPDDDVAYWNYVPISGGTALLEPDSPYAIGTPQDADVYLFSYYQGQVIP
jgi:hypothetical protein